MQSRGEHLLGQFWAALYWWLWKVETAEREQRTGVSEAELSCVVKS